MKITIHLEDREDGGLRVWSDDLHGLVLSHPDRLLVGADIVPAIDELVRRRDIQHDEAEPAKGQQE